MTTFTASTNIQIATTTETTVTVDQSKTAVADTDFALYHLLADVDDYREGEIYRLWDMLYRGWKDNKYDVFETAGQILYVGIPLDKPTIAHRIFTTDIALLTTGMVGIGIGINFASQQKHILPCRMAFERLRNYYKDS